MKISEKKINKVADIFAFGVFSIIAIKTINLLPYNLQIIILIFYILESLKRVVFVKKQFEFKKINVYSFTSIVEVILDVIQFILFFIGFVLFLMI